MNGQFEGAGAQFEIMPFGAGGTQQQAQMEEERGGRRGGGGSVRAPGRRPSSSSAARPPAKPGRGPRRPAPWPVYPVVAWPPRWDQPRYAPDDGAPFAAPDEEPFDDGPEGEVTAAERAVLMRFPPELRAVLLSMPDAERPRYVSLGMLPQAAQDPRANKGGLYLIVFTAGGRRRAYNGQSMQVRRRLLKHLLSATILGLRPFVDNHEVFFAQPPGSATPRDVELKINRRMLKPHKGVLTNQQHEVEAELLGEAWI